MKNIKRKYEDSDKLKARKYYLLGLSISEVSKLTDFPIRTLQKWQSKEKWVKEKNLFITSFNIVAFKTGY